MADPSSVSIVIPAFNESESIAEVVGILRAAAAWREIIVVDDGSTDGTGNIAATSTLLESFPSPGTTSSWSTRINKNGQTDNFSVVVLCADQ